jgi:hypothetical protein
MKGGLVQPGATQTLLASWPLKWQMGVGMTCDMRIILSLWVEGFIETTLLNTELWREIF